MKILTYEEQLKMVELGYAKKSTNGVFDTFKYSRKVMYDYLWDNLKDLGILECRGHTYDNRTGQLVTLPVTKSFNYLELDTWKDVSLDTQVIAFKKYNGFMVAATKYQGEFVVSTTGTTNSNYAQYVKDNHLEEIKLLTNDINTSLFECVAEFDPHIVKEDLGIHFLGVRSHVTGWWLPNHSSTVQCSLKGLLELAKIEKHEGWMVYLLNEGGSIISEDFCKLKTDYYLGKKKLMRMRNVSSIWKQSRSVENTLPDRWKHAVECIKTTFTEDQWKDMTDQQRRIYLETIED